MMHLLGQRKKKENILGQGEILITLPSLIHQDQQSHSENVACPPLVENESFHHVV